MAMAAALKKYLIIKKAGQATTIQNVIICNKYLIVAFLDQKDNAYYEKYSLRKIVVTGKVMYDLNYGEWFKPHQICSILVKLHNLSPLKGT